MTSVQQALALLANLLGDRDHNLFLGNADNDGCCTDAAKHVALIAEGLSGILRVTDIPDPSSPSLDVSKHEPGTFRPSI